VVEPFVYVCVYVKHINMFLESDNTVLLALQQLGRKRTLKIVAVIHIEKTAKAEKCQDSANHKKKK